MDFTNGRVIIFSGAGISAESGLATFRDSNGLWANYDPNIVCNYTNWHSNYKIVHKFYNQRREELKHTKPNIAHILTQKLSQEFEVINITQNVDDFFERAYLEVNNVESSDFNAYSKADILHLHGKLWELRCENCENITTIGYESYDFSPCKKCGNEILKPNIVFFYEQAPKYAIMYEIFDSIKYDDIIIVIGTSGEVVNICAMLNRGYKILNNLAKTRGIDENLFDSLYLEKSTEALPKIYNEIKNIKLYGI